MRPRRAKPKHHDPVFRRRYKDAWPDDEWDTVLQVDPCDGKTFTLDDQRLWMPTELNHIFTNPKRDLTPLVITLSKIHHDWFHENIHAGRLLCLVVKIRKGEADMALWEKAYGHPLDGLADHPQCLVPRMRRFRDEFLCWLLKERKVT